MVLLTSIGRTNMYFLDLYYQAPRKGVATSVLLSIRPSPHMIWFIMRQCATIHGVGSFRFVYGKLMNNSLVPHV